MKHEVASECAHASAPPVIPASKFLTEFLIVSIAGAVSGGCLCTRANCTNRPFSHRALCSVSEKRRNEGTFTIDGRTKSRDDWRRFTWPFFRTYRRGVPLSCESCLSSAF